ncbi:Ger(x)C family spore germination C-terminal domain-containing protein [Paenibacillus amylolyticus]|uniref:Ger(x)C family spore germination C-terminal domain-containing protein n=1 Tax=Paenibacillus amylolyticus TaxID=1451 RepID=UPI0032E3A203
MAGREEQEKILKEGIQNAQHIGSDIFGFGEAFHRKYPSEWHKWKEDWTRKFQHLQVDVNLRYRLNRVGKITNSVDSYQNN